MSNDMVFIWSGHGKGSYVGAFVVIKRFLRREHLNAHKEKLQNAKDVVTFMRKLLSCKLKNHIITKGNFSKGFFSLSN
jgi:hypothetical protein